MQSMMVLGFGCLVPTFGSLEGTINVSRNSYVANACIVIPSEVQAAGRVNFTYLPLAQSAEEMIDIDLIGILMPKLSKTRQSTIVSVECRQRPVSGYGQMTNALRSFIASLATTDRM